jgi:hypothetical protein
MLGYLDRKVVYGPVAGYAQASQYLIEPPS